MKHYPFPKPFRSKYSSTRRRKPLSSLLAFCLICAMLIGSGVGCDTNSRPSDDTTELQGNPVTFQGDFDIVGGSSHLLEQALEASGLQRGAEGLEKIIIVGKSDEPLSLDAKEKVESRENHYNDYAILCNGNQIAIYGGSTYALKQGIQYLLQNRLDKNSGGLALSDRYSHYHCPELTVETIGTVSLKGLTVVANKNTMTVAEDFAHELSVIGGYPVETSMKATDNSICLDVKHADQEGAFSLEYQLAVAHDHITLTAETVVSLSTALKDFIQWFPEVKEWKEGTTMDRTVALSIKKASDTALFKYCGMWEKTDKDNPDTMVSYWGGASVEVDFVGVSITLAFSSSSKCRVQLDGKDLMVKDTTLSGTYTVTAETNGKHTVRVYTNDRENHIHFAGVHVANGIELSRTPNREHYIQFVGDSISDTVSSFSYRAGLVLDWDYCVTAVSGMALENNFGFWYLNNGSHQPNTMSALIQENFGIRTIGMVDAFFKLGVAQENMRGEERELYATKYYTDELNCHYQTGYTPDIVFIFLGTNDQLSSVGSARRFTEAYRTLVEGIFRVYGDDTQICMLQALTHAEAEPNEDHPRFECIRRTANTLMSEYPDNIKFIDRDVILTWNVEISGDHTHPTLNGYNTLTEKIAELLDQYYS